VLFENFSKPSGDVSSFIEIRQEWLVLDTQTCVHLWPYLAQFFLEMEMFQTKFPGKIKQAQFMFSNFFENRAVYEVMWKYYTVEPDGPQIQNSTGHAHCILGA
jgi:hypothetical protein